MSSTYRPTLERLRYWQGQGLRSVDARDQQRFDALRRRLHNRALHTTDGVAFGLAVSVPADDAAAVEVACGLAYDGRGQELMLQRARRIALPAQAGTLLLRMTQRAVASPMSGDGACDAPGAHLLEQDSELAWVAATKIERSRDVLLARWDAGALDRQYLPKRARPVARPRLATGATVQGDTAWEPWIIERTDASGAIVPQTAGVQTHIDTSASGFTQTPRYVATLQAQPHAWDPDRADFAPAFFAHVAEPAPDGFIFRLLMTQVARRRYGAWNGTGRVAKISRGDGPRLLVEVDPMPAFKAGDMVAQLRPRAGSAVVLEKLEGKQLTLSAALDEGDGRLAVGNLPRMASVLKILPDDPTVLAVFTAAQTVKKGDLLRRTSDGALAAIGRVSKGTLTVGQPFLDWVAADALTVARMAAGAAVKNALLSNGGTVLALELKPAGHSVEAGMSIVLLDAGSQVLATVPKVGSRSGATIEMAAPPGLDLQRVMRAVPLLDITIDSLRRRSPNTLELDSIVGFEVDDFVAVATQVATIARVTHVDEAARQIGLSVGLAVQAGSILVGANWVSATTVDQIDPRVPNLVKVGRPVAALGADFVARREDDGFAEPVMLSSVAGNTLTLAAALAGAARLDTLALGRFPRIATVLAADAQGTGITVAESGAVMAGDSVLLMPAAAPGPAARAVLQVVSASGNGVVLSASPGTLIPGDRLAVVQWRDLVRVVAVDPAAPEEIEVDSVTGLRQGDLLGNLEYYADCSYPGYVEKIIGSVLTLLPGLEHGDGIVPHHWIDGGIVGPAAVCLPAAPVPPFPQWQPLLRLETVDGLDARTTATAHGFDLFTGKYQSRSVLPLILDQGSAHLLLLIHGSEPYRFRPETLSLVTGFNDESPRAFASFAQKQKLAVRWIGCQDEQFGPPACPAQGPWNACGPAAPAAISEDS